MREILSYCRSRYIVLQSVHYLLIINETYEVVFENCRYSARFYDVVQKV
jgi:hypothetical protein